MANEATLLIETAKPIALTCADGTGIEKGCLLEISDPITVAAHSNDEGYFGGIAAEEKVASDGRTKLAVYRDGIFKLTTAGAITAGQVVALSATANKVKVSDATCVGGKTVGIALETAAGADETIYVELRPGAAPNAFA